MNDMGRLGLSIVGSWLIVLLKWQKLLIFEASTSSQSNESSTNIDNHADTMVLGSDCQPVHDFEKLVDISGWDASAGSVE